MIHSYTLVERIHPWDHQGKLSLCTVHFVFQSSSCSYVIWLVLPVAAGKPEVEDARTQPSNFLTFNLFNLSIYEEVGKVFDKTEMERFSLYREFYSRLKRKLSHRFLVARLSRKRDKISLDWTQPTFFHDLTVGAMATTI